MYFVITLNVPWGIEDKIGSSLFHVGNSNLSFPNFSKVFTTAWDAVKNLAISITEKLQKVIDAILNFDLKAFLGRFSIFWPFKTKVKDLLNLSDHEWNIQSIELKFSRIMAAVEQLFNSIMTMILELWMKLVKAFFNAIGLGALLAYIPFTFCTFFVFCLVASCQNSLRGSSPLYT